VALCEVTKKCLNTQLMDDDLHVLEFLDLGGPMSFMYINLATTAIVQRLGR
jgi:hypothetical protein